MGFSVRNLLVVQTRLNVAGPPRTLNELTSVCMPGRSSSVYWNGGEPKCAVISLFEENIAVIASGWLIVTVSGSSLFCWPGPNACSAAISNVTAWIETLTAGNAILSRSVRSFRVLTFGLRDTRYSGIEFSAAAALMS